MRIRIRVSGGTGVVLAASRHNKTKKPLANILPLIGQTDLVGLTLQATIFVKHCCVCVFFSVCLVTERMFQSDL